MSKYVAKGINVACRTIDGNAIIFKEDTRDLLKLDPVGSFIWDQINGCRTVGQISEICCDVLDGDRKEIISGVAEFVATLIDSGVAVVSDKPFEGVMASAC